MYFTLPTLVYSYQITLSKLHYWIYQIYLTKIKIDEIVIGLILCSDSASIKIILGQNSQKVISFDHRKYPTFLHITSMLSPLLLHLTCSTWGWCSGCKKKPSSTVMQFQSGQCLTVICTPHPNHNGKQFWIMNDLDLDPRNN